MVSHRSRCVIPTTGRFRPCAARTAEQKKLGAVAKWLRQRIANPPSSVRIRPAPLAARTPDQRAESWLFLLRRQPGIIHAGRNEVAEVRAGTEQPLKRPKFRRVLAVACSGPHAPRSMHHPSQSPHDRKSHGDDRAQSIPTWKATPPTSAGFCFFDQTTGCYNTIPCRVLRVLWSYRSWRGRSEWIRNKTSHPHSRIGLRRRGFSRHGTPEKR